jgi:hypothetical protein
VWMRGRWKVSLLHMVRFCVYFPFLSKVLSPICSRHEADRLDQRQGDNERERESESERQTGRHGERGRGRESARACVRAAFGALGICAPPGGALALC